MAKQTVIDRIEIDRDAVVGVRLAFEMVDEEDGEVTSQGVHRLTLTPGMDLVAKVTELNQHLITMKKKPLVAADRQRIKKVLDAYWTQPVIDAYAAKVAAAQASMPGGLP